MALTVEIEDRWVRFVFAGATAARDVYAVFHRAFDRASPDAEVLIDLRASTSLADRTPELVRMLTEFVLTHPQRPGRRAAVILPPDQVEQWEPIAEDARRQVSAEFELFTDSAKAEAWLIRD